MAINEYVLAGESVDEPIVRVIVEALGHDTCQKSVDEVVNRICENGYKSIRSMTALSNTRSCF